MCGVFGAFSPDGKKVLEDVYLGLYALQHRGQEAAGVAWTNATGGISSRKGNGLVHLALDQADLAAVESSCAIGHVRYSTTGGSELSNAQPLTASTSKCPIAVAHNGNLTNAQGLKLLLQNRGAIFHSTTDTEVILHLIAHQPHKQPLDALLDSLVRLRGAYSLAMILGNRLVAARDPWGFRPLVLGRRDNIHYVSSETCALNLVGASVVREIEPGEVIIIGEDGVHSIRLPVEPKRRFGCAFEFVYFARPDSVISGRSVYAVRKELGKKLAKRAPCREASLVTGMPDSGTIASLGYAEESGVPYEQSVVRNRYVGRTFIEPTSRVRHLGVRIKLNPITEVLQGKNVVVVDDSIVRGTTCERMISMIKSCGANQVHVRISSPPVRFPCYYGIDTPTRVELAAARMNLQQLEQEVGADSLAYITEEDLLEAIGLPAQSVCTACFSGDYMEGGEEYEPQL
ncbi:MAG TPA: amidophosphoribosyltransferase [Synergistales bacterium]|nr:amidophosphoribosyltransferase [Synergistales bacterium]